MSKMNRRSFFGGALASAAVASPLAAQMAMAANSKGSTKGLRTINQRATPVEGPRSRNTLGKIVYIDDDTGKERGREWFGFTYRPDGEITLRAYCEIDDTRVERDCVQTMNSQFHPRDVFVRLHGKGKFLGTGWIRIEEDKAECEVFNVQMGRVHQVMPLERPAHSIVTHPLSADAVMMAEFDHSKPDRIQSWPGGLSTSPLLDGGSGPFLSKSYQRTIEYLGPERVTVPAGTFDTHHYRFVMGGYRKDGIKTEYEVWATHPDFIFVKGIVRGYLVNKSGSGTYELTELYTDNGPNNG
jgi:hypothetical protein